MEQDQSKTESAAAVRSSDLLAVLRENAEAQRATLKRLAADPYYRETRDKLDARASAVFDLLEIISRTERQCTANAPDQRPAE